MRFEIAPSVRKLIINRGCEITVSIEKEQCYACAGNVCIPYLFARIGRPEDSLIEKYRIISEDGICIYVSNDFEKLDTAVTFAIELQSPDKDNLDIYGVSK